MASSAPKIFALQDRPKMIGALSMTGARENLALYNEVGDACVPQTVWEVEPVEIRFS